MTAKTDKQDPKEATTPQTDPIATILFVIFIGTMGYLLTASMVGLYPWLPVLDTVYFIPTLEAVVTFLSILAIMFLSLIGGLVRMRYSIILVGIVILTAVFILTFYTMLLFAGLTAPMP
jgi:hypothetical protein